jgi:hypothetical protein
VDPWLHDERLAAKAKNFVYSQMTYAGPPLEELMEPEQNAAELI